MSDVLVEPRNLGEVLLYEEENYFYSRDEARIASGEAIVLGQVLSLDEDSGEYSALEIVAGDTPSVSAVMGVAIREIVASESAVETVVLVRHAIVKRDGLVWPEGITQAQQDSVIAQLAGQGILVRS